MMDEMMEQQELLASRAERAAALRESNARLAAEVRRLSDAAEEQPDGRG